MTKKIIQKICLTVLAALAAVAVLPSAALATGDGTGGGGGAAVPLYMDWSYPGDGAADVSINPVIQCKFSHNVAQGNVSERNKTFITLEDADGDNVDITIFMADAQIEFDKRQFIYVSPVGPLRYGTTYILTIHEGIQAKNYMTTDQVQTVTFTTEYARSSFNAPLVQPPVSTELSGGDGLSAGAGVSWDESERDDGGSDTGEVDDGPDVEAGISSGNETDGSGEESGSAGDGEDRNDTGDTAGIAAVENGNGDSGSPPADGTDTGGAAGEADAGAKRAAAAGVSPVTIAVAVLLTCLIAGAAAAGIWSGRTCRFRKKRRGHIAFLLVLTLLAGSFGAANTASAAVPKEFTVRVFVGDTLVSETAYTDAELRAMPQIRQTYSGIDEDGLPCTVGAEGVALSDLVEAQGVDLSEVESISIYGLNDWLRNMTCNYLYGMGRYYFPHLSEAYRIRESMAEEEKPSEEEPSEEEPSEEEPSEEAPSEEAPSEGEPSEEEPPEEAPPEEELSEEEPSEEEPSGEEPSEEEPSEEEPPEEVSEEEPLDGDFIDPDVYQSQDAVRVVPMLALRVSTRELEDEVSWSSLSTIVGYRFCFGQVNAADGAYLMYGYNLQGIDIKVSAAGEFAEENDLQDLVGNRVPTPGGADSVGSADVAGPYTNPLTGETIEQLPCELEIQVGYFGTEYYTIKTFTFEELAAMPQIRQAYSAVSKDGTNGMLTAMGVRLVDVITAAGVDVNSVSAIGFFRGNQEGAAGVTASKAWLLDMNRYYYPNLTSAWNYTTGGKGAARSAVRTDVIIALKDYWDAQSAVPDFFRLDGTHRYRLVYGQTSTRADNMEKSVMWISTIKIQLEGSPSGEDWLDEYLGRLIGSGEGGGTGSGGGWGAGSLESAVDPAPAETAPVVDMTEASETKIDAPDGQLEKIDTREKHIYELYGSPVSWDLGAERQDYGRYIAAVLGLTALLGACVSYISYRYRIRNKKRGYFGERENT